MLLSRTHSRLKVVWELFQMAQNHRNFVLIPFFLVLGGAAVLLLAVQVFEYVAPFVYTLF